MVRKRIGELLLERGAITRAQLEQGLATQQQTRKRLGLTLIELKIISDLQLAQVLAESLKLPLVNLREAAVDWSAVHMLRARICETHELFPYAMEGKGQGQKKLLVAMADPLNLSAQEEIGFVTGLKVVVAVATHNDVREAILRYYHKVNPDDAPDGKMSLVERGGTVRVLDMTGDEPEAVVVGEEIISATSMLPPLRPGGPNPPVLQPPKPAAPQQPRKPALSQTVSKDLDFLFGNQAAAETETVENLERKFWALLKVLTRKGVMTREELLAELESEER